MASFVKASDSGDDPMDAADLNQLIEALNGEGNYPLSVTGVNDTANYALDLKNNDASNDRALRVKDAGDVVVFRVDAAGVVASPDVDGTAAAKVVTTTHTQTLTNKTLTAPVLNTPTLILKNSASEAPTVEGDIRWDSDDDALVVGDGATTKTFYPGRFPSPVRLPAGAWSFPSANFPQPLNYQSLTNWPSVFLLAFDTTTEEACFTSFDVPIGNTFTAATIYIHSFQPAATSGTLGWKITTISRAASETIDTAGALDTATAATVPGTAKQLQIISKALTVTGWAAGERVFIKLARDVANDTVAEDAYFVGASIAWS